jgi:hypothetical protein
MFKKCQLGAGTLCPPPWIRHCSQGKPSWYVVRIKSSLFFIVFITRFIKQATLNRENRGNDYFLYNKQNLTFDCERKKSSISMNSISAEASSALSQCKVSLACAVRPRDIK